MKKIMKNIDGIKSQSIYTKDIDGKKNIVHSNEACEQSGATLVRDENKIKKFIKEGKVSNGTNGVFI